ncbi:hypothetical protein CcCBS67573_g02688 [Chytriomyces confervae]|uniref:MIR domain-containing protein n=1 Tax=Chytriomyces confervae TaxID=246404 RepID=A0A507FK04_9FUNG|nr:hypothetical protein CcCBS67573_g02688 [Chytriomyces confervae]
MNFLKKKERRDSDDASDDEAQQHRDRDRDKSVSPTTATIFERMSGRPLLTFRASVENKDRERSTSSTSSKSVSSSKRGQSLPRDSESMQGTSVPDSEQSSLSSHTTSTALINEPIPELRSTLGTGSDHSFIPSFTSSAIGLPSPLSAQPYQEVPAVPASLSPPPAKKESLAPPTSPRLEKSTIQPISNMKFKGKSRAISPPETSPSNDSAPCSTLPGLGMLPQGMQLPKPPPAPKGTSVSLNDAFKKSPLSDKKVFGSFITPQQSSSKKPAKMLPQNTTTPPDRFLQLGDELVLMSEQNRMLFSDGQVKKRAFVLENWAPRAATSGDLMKCVYRIEPQMVYRDSKVYRQSIECDVDDDLFYNGLLQRAAIPKDGEDPARVESLKQAAILEARNNEVDFLRLRGQTVIYGSIVQLYNIHTRRYLSVNSRETCHHEPTAMPIEMERELRRECLFRILPKFRIRVDGEPVRCGDVMVFKSVATEAYLNSAKFKLLNDTAMINIACQPIGYPVDEPPSSPTLDIREACASVQPHGWTMRLFRAAQNADYHPLLQPVISPTAVGVTGNPQNPLSALGIPFPATTSTITPTVPTTLSTTSNRTIQGGKFICLYHKEKGGYLACPPLIKLAEATFQAGGLDEQKVQLHEYHFDPLNPQDGSSCLSMWQIENAADCLSGEAIQWGSPVRLRHAANNMYLAVRKNFELSTEEGDDSSGLLVELVPASRDKNSEKLGARKQTGSDETLENDATVFVFGQVNTETMPVISSGAFLRIQHYATSAWLHPTLAEKMEKPFKSRKGMSVATRPDFIVATTENHMDDYFAVSIAEQDLVDKFNFVHSYLPWILQFVIRERQGCEATSAQYPIRTREDRTFRMILTSLIYFCTKSNTMDPFKREGTPILLHQTLLRETSIVDILLRFLTIPFDAGERFKLQVALHELQSGHPCEIEPMQNRHIEITDAADSPNGTRTRGKPIRGRSRSVQRSAVSPRDTAVHYRVIQSNNTFSIDGTGQEATVSAAEIKRGDHEILARLFRHIYRVLKQFLLGSEHTNQSHVAENFMTISSHIDLNIGAADTLMQLIDGNPSIVQKISDVQIESFISLLARDRNPSYVSFLIAMCYCDGISMPAHQLTIATKLLAVTAAEAAGQDSTGTKLVKDDLLPTHLFRTRVSASNSLEVLPATERLFRKWIPLEELCIKTKTEPQQKLVMAAPGSGASRRRTMSGNKLKGLTSSAVDHSLNKKSIPQRAAVAEYFEATLKLYRALCLGQNSKVIQLLTTVWSIISLEECYVGVCNDNLPDTVRALYGDLIRVVFIDRFPITPLISDYVFPIESIQSHPTFTEILKRAQQNDGSSEYAILTQLPAWASTFLATQSKQVAQHVSANQFVLSILKLTKALVNFGFVNDEKSIKDLFRILMTILDGKTDSRDDDMASSSEKEKSGWWTAERFEFNEWNQPIIQSKIEICLIMEQLVQLRLEMRTYLFLHYWYDFFRPGGKQSSSESKTDIACGYSNIQTLLATIMDETAYFRLRDVLSPILLELLRYESPKLKQCAVRLLHRMFASVEEIIDISRTCILLNDEPHINTYHWIQHQLSIFTESGVGTAVASESIKDTILGGIDFQAASKMMTLLENLAHLCVLGTVTTGPTASDTVISGVNSDEQLNKPDSVNQVVIRNLGIHKWVFALLKNRLAHAVAKSVRPSDAKKSGGSSDHSADSRLSSEPLDAGASSDSLVLPDQRSIETLQSPLKVVQSGILKSVFEFLFRFADGNPTHQGLIIENIELLLDCTNPRLSGATEEISFTCVEYLGYFLQQSPDICVKLTDQHILQILELSRGNRWEYIRLLKCLVRADGKILKRNQGMVLKNLLENRKTYLDLNQLLSMFKRDLAEHLKSLQINGDGLDNGIMSLESRVTDVLRSHSRLNSANQSYGSNLELAAALKPISRKSTEKREEAAPLVPIEYFEQVISLLAECCEDGNYMMQLMCQTILSVNEILTMLNSTLATIPLKNSLACLLVTAFIEAAGEEDNEKHPERIHKDARSWRFLELITNHVSECKNELRAKRPIDKDAEAFLFGGIVKFITSFFSHFQQSTSFQNSESHAAIEQLVDDLTDLAHYSRSQKKKCDLLVGALRAIADAGFEGHKYNGSEYDHWRIGDRLQSQSPPGSFELSGEYLENKNVFAVNEGVMDLLNRIAQDPAIKSMSANEFRMLAAKFELPLDKKPSSPEFISMCSPTKSIIQYLEESANGTSVQTQAPKRGQRKRRIKTSKTRDDVKYDIKTLKILEALITEQIKNVESVDRSRHPDKWLKAEALKVLAQKLLNNLGCTLMAEKLLTSDRVGVFSASLRVLIVLLDGGNREIQNTLENYWLGTREERFFYCVHETMKKYTVQVREIKELQDIHHSNPESDGTAQNEGASEPTTLKPTIPGQGTPFGSHSSIMVSSGISDSKNSLLSVSEYEVDAPSVAGSGGSEDGEYSAIRSVMRLLQLLVEGHNFRIQEYMRIQPDNIKTFNLIRDVVDFLHAAVAVHDAQVIPLMIQVFDTLIDLSQGSTQNQVIIFQAKIVQAINYILVSDYKFCSEDQVVELKGKSALCLLSLLEDDADDDTRAVFKQMALTVDLQGLLKNLDNAHNLVSKEEEERRQRVRAELKAMANRETIVKATQYAFAVTLELVQIITQEALDEWKVTWRPRVHAMLKIIWCRFNLKASTVSNDETESLAKTKSEPSLPTVPENPSDCQSNRGGFLANLKQEIYTQEGESESETEENESSPKEMGFIYSMLIATLLPYMTPDSRSKCERNLAFNSFNNKTGRIEIVRELNNAVEKRLYTVLFPIPDICFHLRSYTKDRFLWMRKRNTPQEKVEDFVNQSQDIIYEIRNQSLVEENIWLKKLAKGHSYWWRSAYILTLLINVGNMFCMVAPTGNLDHDDFSKCPAFVDHGRTFLGLIQIFFWILSSSEFMVTQLPLLINRRRIQQLINENSKIKQDNEQRAWEGGEKIELKSVQELQSTELKTVDLFRGFFYEPKAFYHAAMVLLAVLGLQYPSLYAVHLLDFMYRDAVLHGVIASVTMNWSSLSKTVLLGVIIIYIYSVIGFVFFRHAFNEQQGLHCQSLFSCFLTVLSYGLRSGGGIGELLEVPVDPKKEYYGARVVLDLTFFLIVIVFLLNVVFGIIFDTFGQLREERKDINDDLRNQCYICSINASEFQRHSAGFEHHIKKEHNIWHYLFFLVHLDLKDKTEYTSHETFISESLAKNDLAFFPINRAIALKNREESDNVAQQMQSLETNMAWLMDGFNSVRAQVLLQTESMVREVTVNGNGRLDTRASRMNLALGTALAAAKMSRNKSSKRAEN